MASAQTFPTRFSEPAVHAILNKDSFRTAVELARQGFLVVPIETIDPDGRCSCGNLSCRSPGKHPHRHTAPHGVKDATSDVEETRERFALYHPLNVGLALGGRHVALDLDPRAGVDLNDQFGLEPTNTEITGGGGEHRFYLSPPGLTLRTGRLPSGAEVKAANSYVVVSPGRHASGGEYHNPNPSLAFARIPSDWSYLRELAVPTKQLRLIEHQRTPAPMHFARAERVWDSLLTGPFAPTFSLLIDGRWQEVLDEDGKPRYSSQSEADASLLFAAAWFTTDPRVLDATLRQSGLKRAKWEERPDYRALQITFAIEGRRRQQDDRRRIVAEAAGIPLGRSKRASTVTSRRSTRSIPIPKPPDHPPLEAKDVLVGTVSSTSGRHRVRNSVINAVVNFASNAPAEHRRVNDWVRVPVQELADLLKIDRKTVQRAIEHAAETGLILTEHRVVHINGEVRRDRLVRMISTRK